MAFQVSETARDVLRRSVVTADRIDLPGQLDRKSYVEVKKVIEGLGGKWDRRRGTHVFTRDPREVLAEVLETGKGRNLKAERQAFFTPRDLAVYLVRRAGVQPGDRVLEPSAGVGAIAQAIREAGGHPTCVEMDQFDAAELTRQGFDTLQRNFLELEPYAPLCDFDAVVMNPPLTGAQDVAYVQHAARFLRPGGRLVVVVL